MWSLQSNGSNCKYIFIYLIIFLLKFAKVSKELPDVKFVKVNGDDFEELVEKYEIAGFPTFALFKNGEMLDSKSGKMDEATLKKYIESKM